jgi:hypothetical protein
MKNKNTDYIYMTEEERSMTLFYTMEGLRETLEFIERELDTEAPFGPSHLAMLADIDDLANALYNKVHKKTKEAINYAI